jgi:hypothetical protein
MVIFKVRVLIITVAVAAGFFLQAAVDDDVLAQADSHVSPANDSSLIEEASQRKSILSSEGFNVIDNLGNPTQTELDVPVDGESVISLWFATTQGALVMELLDSNGHPALDADQHSIKPMVWRGEQSLVLEQGRYTVKLHANDGARVYAVIGIRFLHRARCDIKGLTPQQADSGQGYWWPYLLIRPASPKLPGADTLLVLPNNAAFATQDLDVLRAIAQCSLLDNGDINLELAKSLGTPILIPLFPRPELKEIASNLQLQALTRASFEEISPRSSFARVDLQLMAMIDAARKKMKDLAPDWPPIREQVLMAGLSAAGSFTNRFTILHPARVLAAAVGSPAGWPIAPVVTDQGKTLRYPVGVAEVQDLVGHPVDLAALRHVRLLFFLGDHDTNDAVGIVDNYSPHDSELIKCLFGETLPKRWRSAERLYDRAGMGHVQFKIYPGGHEVTAEMRKDILDTFRKALDAH